MRHRWPLLDFSILFPDALDARGGRCSGGEAVRLVLGGVEDAGASGGLTPGQKTHFPSTILDSILFNDEFQ